MYLPLWFRLFWAFIILLVSANIPFLLIGPFWGAPAIILTTLWVGNSYRWRDSAYFIMLKFWFMGSFVVSLVEIVRQYHILEEKGVGAYLTRLQWCIGLGLICVLVSGILGGVLHSLMHLAEYLATQIELWIAQETKIYKKTYLYRKTVYWQKKINGVWWRLKNWFARLR
jgi:hypothetical protein